MPFWLACTLSAVPAVTALAAVAALVYNARTYSRARTQQQVDICTRLFLEIRGLEKDYYLLFADKSEQERSRWDSLFLNTLEYFSFLVNRGHLEDKAMVEFFGPAFVEWREVILRRHVQGWEDPHKYEEFKELCRRYESHKET